MRNPFELLPEKSVTVLMLALVTLVAIDVDAYRGAVEYGDAVAVVNRSHQVLAVLNGTMADLISAESEIRGYTITGNEQFLSLYGGAVDNVYTGLMALEKKIVDAESRVHLGKLNELCKARLERLEFTLKTRQAEGFDAVLQGTGPGKALMDESRRVASLIVERQQHLLEERTNRARRSSLRTVVVVVLGSLLAVVFLGASILMLINEMRRRSRLESEVLQISEREQRRIGQDLHDGLCQQLTGISLLSRGLQQKASGEIARDLEQITSLINESIGETRLITRGLLPVPDEGIGLMVALGDLAESISRMTELTCRFECPLPVPISDRVVATNLYRIAQEATQNVIRHADASQITLFLKRDEEAIYLEVVDDGRGIKSGRASKGMGLEIMNYRARSIHGRLEIHEGKEGGTVVSCKLPIELLP